MRKLFALAALLLLIFTGDARPNAIIVLASCGTTPSPAPVSGAEVTYVDTNGNACSASSGSSTISGSVTVQDGTTASQKLAVGTTGAASVNNTQVNGVARSTGTGAVGTGSPRVAVGTDANTVAGSTPDPCLGLSASKTQVAISQAASARLVVGTSAKKTYVCYMMVVGSDAENLSVVGGTGSTCGTNTVALVGGSTAANGPNLAANGGFVIGTGGSWVASTTVAADDLCLLQSGSGRVAGSLVYVQQ